MTRIIAVLLVCASSLSAQTPRSPLTQSGAPQARASGVQPGIEIGAAPVVLGAVRSFNATSNGIEVVSENGRTSITALEDGVIRVRATRGHDFAQRFSYAVLPAPSKTAQKLNVQSSQTANAIEVQTAALRISIDRRSSMISFLAADGTRISGDAAPTEWRGEQFTIRKIMPEDEHYFGLGDKAGPLDHRNQAFTMWNTDAYAWQESTDPLYKTIGFLVAYRKGASYGILLDNTFRQHWDLGKAAGDEYSFGADGGELDYYFIYGPRPKRVVETYTALTGRQPLPPLWSLGFQQCRYSYFPEARVREIVSTYKQKKIPLDVIYLDIDYQLENRPFTVDPQKFPSFRGMVHDFLNEGVKTIVITDLHIAHQPGYAPYDTGHAGDFFIKNPDGSEFVGPVWPGPSVFPDFSRKAARDWWGTLYKDFSNAGVAGFWNDMNEPSVFERADKTIPVDAVDRIEEPGFPARTSTQREVHNILGMLNAQGTYEGLLKLKPNERPFVLTRATYAGGQRYSASWTGDNSSSWNHMRISVPMLQNLGISGIASIGADIGGFKGSPQPDLLTKWLELGAFNPIDRDHTEKGTLDQEPWVHGPEHEAIRKRYIEERYRLLPYIYTSFEEASRDGLPVMRPMFLEYPEQEKLVTEGDWKDNQYFFGHDLLVIPAQFPDFVQKYKAVLPQGNLWYEYWSGKQLTPGEMFISPALEVLPVFVRGGAIIPRQPLVQNTAEKPQGPLELRVYPDRTCQGSLYLDDGNSFNYLKGEYLRVDYSCEGYEDALRVKISPQQGSYKPWFTQIQTVIYGVKKQPASIQINGQAVSPGQYNATDQTLTLQFPNAPQGVELRLSCGAPGATGNTCFSMTQSGSGEAEKE